MVEGKLGRILVAEDNPDIREIIQDLFETRGHKIFLAEDGAEAWRICQEPNSNLSLLLTDIDMPRMNGIELIERVKKDYSNLPIVAYTGTHGYEARDAGADYVLQKPCSNKVLVEKVEEALNGKKQE